MKFKTIHFLIAALAGTIIFSTQSVFSKPFNGFDVSKISIDSSKILGGGPGKDGIPSINNPKFISPIEVDFLGDDDLVISYTHNGDTKAYPIRILVWHEIVNDVINKQSIAVTYCPLCGTGMVFDRTIDNKVHSFGVSGLLYFSDVLMYDRETDSLWSQLGMKGVSNESIGKDLKWLVSTHMTWKAWKQKFPSGKVLSTDTGSFRQYTSSAYASYFKSDRTMFPVPKFRTELAQKDKVVGVIINGQAKAYSMKHLKKSKVINDKINGQQLSIEYDAKNRSITTKNGAGIVIPSVEAYWFAWQGFYPDTLLDK